MARTADIGAATAAAPAAAPRSMSPTWRRFREAFRRHPTAILGAAIPVMTIIGVGIALLISGAIVTETVFALPGIGRLTVDAILRRDYPIIQGVILIFSAIYVLVNLLVDLSYMLFDPRIRY